MEGSTRNESVMGKALTTQTSSELTAAQETFVAICAEAQNLQIADNAGAAFRAAVIVKALRDLLTPNVMIEAFMPLMNTKVGFLTDHDPKKISKSTGKPQQAYSMEIVRDAIIDAVTIGLLPTGNQFNIISERMYPTKEGYAALLKRIGCKHWITMGSPKVNTDNADIDCVINYEWHGEKKAINYKANVKKDGFSSIDQIKGKAERKAKKVLYEYLTGIDLGDADETSSEPIDEQPNLEDRKAAMRANITKPELF